MVGPQTFITTHVKQAQYTMVCDKEMAAGPDGVPLLAIDPDCIEQEAASPTGYPKGPTKGTDPAEPNTNAVFFDGFVAGVEDATILISHTVSGSVVFDEPLEKNLRQMTGHLMECEEGSVNPD